ncbi:hypothetical protein A8L34_00040 [Bacillus sp. FJAT-27264]|uniref:hypothetical protein n=1 Tax=Paenibacillus sp. (strain DSM 101736 / FJAT-27264) TaxID=1850362 RepID=UPI00080809AA|nr:hypothetical protein [Bacillus sp. FJAT-27264]OBZ18020.1 hypothetical protein A8L34_00040 [Bacillus sp. FJAT-27264]
MVIKGNAPATPVPPMDEAISHLIESITSEENALTSLLETEAGHIRAFCEEKLGESGSTAGEIIQFNHSVIQFMDSFMMAEWMLLKKLDTALQLDQGDKNVASGLYEAQNRTRDNVNEKHKGYYVEWDCWDLNDGW